jgi:polar amino acid transport system substrate-binding protein
MRRWHVPAAVGALLMVTAAACSSGATTSAPSANAAAPAAATAGPSTTAAAAAACGDPTASLRPPASMPSPGQMPAGTYMQTIQSRGRLIVGVDQTTLLFGSLNPLTNKIEGFDIDVLKEVAKAIFGGPDVESHIDYKAITSAQRIPFIQAGTVDIVGRTMTITCDRIKQVSFSTVYYQAGQKVLVRSDSPARGIGDLGGQKVCADTGSTSLDNIRNAASHPVPFAVDDWTDCLVALQRNQVNAISTDDSILAGLAAQDPYTKVVGPSFSPQPYGLAIDKKHPEFVSFVNGVLARMRADGTWAALYNKWLAAHLGPVPAPPPATYSN